MTKKGHIIRKGERIPFIQTQGGFAKAEAATDLWVEFLDDCIEIRPISTGSKIDSAVIVRESGPLTFPMLPKPVRINGEPVDLFELALGVAP